MPRIRTLQDLQAWQAALKLAKSVYIETRTGPVSRDYSYSDQIRRASVSTMSNVAEAYGRRTPKDRSRILDIARGSGKEVESLIYLGSEIGYFNEEQFGNLFAMSDDALGLVSGWQRSIRAML